MTNYHMIKIKKNGRVDIPLDSAYEIGVLKGSYFLLEIAPVVKEARLEQIALPGKDLAEIQLIIKDKLGVLSRISNVFAKNHINILFNESEEISPRKAVLISVVDISRMSTTLSDLEKKLAAMDEVIEISINHIE